MSEQQSQGIIQSRQYLASRTRPKIVEGVISIMMACPLCLAVQCLFSKLTAARLFRLRTTLSSDGQSLRK